MNRAEVAVGRGAKLAGIAGAVPVALRLKRAGRIPVYLDLGGRGGPGGRWAPLIRAGLIRCVLVEPEPVEAERLSRALPGYNVVACALGDRAEVATLRVTRQPGVSSLLTPLPPETLSPEFRDDYVVEREVKVETREWDSLDNVPSPTFVKLDVQGYELRVLEGMTASLESVVALQVEVSMRPSYYDQPKVEEVRDWLDARGFSLRDLRPLGLATHGADEFNAFFERRDLSHSELLAATLWERLLRIPSHTHLAVRSD